MELVVRSEAEGWLFEGPHGPWPCSVGRGGLRRNKQEGDGATPIGRWPLRRLFYRPDREDRPGTRLPSSPLAPNLGWCDDPDDALYNQPVKLPYPGRHETLWRKDALYDLIVVLGYNDAPPLRGAGSAIFLHVATLDYDPTEGCVALAKDHLRSLLGAIGPGDHLVVEAPGPE